MTVSAYAKVNLTLEVYGRRPDGYHDLRSFVAPISLADTLDVGLSDGDITSDTGFSDDLCVKAACALRSLSPGPCPFGTHIRVTKRIPVGGGLGGGSADAAAVLRALNVLWRLGRTPEELAEIGATVGSDVPALVLAQHYRRIVLMEGRGEKVTPLLSSGLDGLYCRPRSRHLVLANPDVGVSTAEVYRLCVPRTEPAAVAVNDLEKPAESLHPEIARTLAALRTAGATDARMSGSGATCFGFVADESAAVRVAEALKAEGLRSWPVCMLT